MAEQTKLDTLRDETVSGFSAIFGTSPEAGGLAPGRVEVLGNHTDYNGGYVMSAAIDKRTCVVAKRAPGDAITMKLLDTAEEAVASVSEPKHVDAPSWPNYLIGVIDQIRRLPNAPRFDGMSIGIRGDVPLGGGLSSSASLEVATAVAVRGLYPFDLDDMGLAQMCQRAENEFVGVKSGLLDQFSSVFGKRDHLLFLDCLTLEHDALALAAGSVALVVCESMVKHELTGSEYNTRRAECESAARKLGKKMLRDVTPEILAAGKHKLTDNEYKRARHVVDEDERVLQARDAVRAGDLPTLGRLMSESHESSRTCFENSTPELDQLQQIAVAIPGCLGARLTGGGFGGSVLSLVESVGAAQFSERIADEYGKRIGKRPSVFVCKIGGGAEPVRLR